MTDTNEREPTLAAMEAASESTRTACHVAGSAPSTPESLYARTGVLAEVFGRLRQVAFTLGNHVERAPSDAFENGLLLDTDDDVPVDEYIHEARRLLADVAAKVEEATYIADQAHSALSHLKLTEQ